ncbi:MAG: TULIP family P47-like protein [Saprospiraceae bacterium]|nr:TULIP family P47-like protein [Saprospiraceae bacterium]
MANTINEKLNTVSVRLPELDQAAPAQGLKLGSGMVLADTNGWDLVDAISLSTLNKNLQGQKKGPGAFSKTLSGNGINASINGQFGQIQVVPGGAGKNLMLAVPVSSGTLVINSVSTQLDKATVIVEAKLAFSPALPSTAPPLTPTGTDYNLIVNATPETNKIPAVSVLDVEFPTEAQRPNALAEALLKEVLQAWFDDNIAQLQQLSFTKVTLGKAPSDDSLQWLSPTYASYAYIDSGTGADGLFGILLQTQGRKADQLFQTLSPVAIPVGSSSALLIDPQVLMASSVFPGFFNGIKNSKADDFQLINNDTEIVNKSGTSFAMDSISHTTQTSQGPVTTTYYPYLTSVDLVARDLEFEFSMEVKVNVAPGVDLYVDILFRNKLELTTKTDGTKTIKMVQQGDPVVQHRIVKSDPAIVIETLLPVILALIGGVGGAAAKEVGGKVVIFILIAMVRIGLAAGKALIGQIEEKGVEAALPSINGLVLVTAGAVQWTDDSFAFSPVNATMNGSVQIGGA